MPARGRLWRTGIFGSECHASVLGRYACLNYAFPRKSHSLLRRNQIHQGRGWYEKNRILDALNLSFPGLIGIHLADQWRRLDPKAIVLDESHDPRINPGIEQPENYVSIAQMSFVNHGGANYTPELRLFYENLRRA
jgi:hypothetical protein